MNIQTKMLNKEYLAQKLENERLKSKIQMLESTLVGYKMAMYPNRDLKQCHILDTEGSSEVVPVQRHIVFSRYSSSSP